MDTAQKISMAKDLAAMVISMGMICNIIEVPVRNYKHIHLEIISQSGCVLAEAIDQGKNSFNVRFFEDLSCHETLCKLSVFTDYLNSRFDSDSRICFSMEARNCYRVWIEE